MAKFKCTIVCVDPAPRLVFFLGDLTVVATATAVYLLVGPLEFSRLCLVFGVFCLFV